MDTTNSQCAREYKLLPYGYNKSIFLVDLPWMIPGSLRSGKCRTSMSQRRSFPHGRRMMLYIRDVELVYDVIRSATSPACTRN